MIDFLKYFLKTVETEPDRPAVIDRGGERITTYRELCSYAFRVNGWIRTHGLGREDISAIYFPKSMEYVAARLGIIMSGSAWVGLEDLMGQERMDFVIRDSGCKVVFDEEKWADAMQYDACCEIADSDAHDLAFIIYTSGSTGTPKGIMQEYGLYDNIVECARDFFVPHGEIRFAEVAPQTFISGVFSTVGMFSVKGTLHEIPADMARDPNALIGYFRKENISDSFLPPTLLRFFLHTPDLRLRAVCAGGDSVSEPCTDQFTIANIYSSTEFGYPACLFRIDKPYSNTPVGEATCGADVVLLDENGRASDEGEFCITIPYFRGYLRDDRSCFITMNGKTYFRSNDYVRRDQEGRYIVLSRMDDMVKINGNRVDLREAESAVKRVLSVDVCCVRLLMRNGVRMLCAYYTGNSEIESGLAAQALHAHIPEYMIPSCYNRLDTFPLNANGKVDRRALPEPDLTLRLVPYVPPEDGIQEMLCAAFESVLETAGDIGIDDDLFSRGVDSLKAMEVISECDIPELSVQMLYEGRTVRRITELLEAAAQKEENTGTLHTTAPLTIGQLYLLRTDLQYPETCMLNLPLRLGILQTVDMDRLADAIRKAIKAHPALLSTITERDGSYDMVYRPELDCPICVEQISDDALEQAAACFVQPFRPDGSPLIRCRVIKTAQQNVVFLDVYHVICDGSDACGCNRVGGLDVPVTVVDAYDQEVVVSFHLIPSIYKCYSRL